MSKEQINSKELEEFLKSDPDVAFVDAIMFDLAGKPIGKRYPVADVQSLFTNGTQFCAGATMLDAVGECHDVCGIGFTDGDPDAVCMPVPGTLKTVPWSEIPLAQCLIEMKNETDPMGWWFDPRSILKRVLSRFEEMGLTPVIACELEFYLLDNARDQNGMISSPVSSATGRVNDAPRVLSFEKLDEFDELLYDVDLVSQLQGMRAGAASSEYGRGQYEVNLAHTDDAVLACDHALLLKRAVKGIARKHGYDATFMASPFVGQSGNGLHIHLSLIDKNGENIFTNKSSEFEHAIAGLQQTMYDALAIFAPNINAYRRFAPDNFVPVNNSWDHNNRYVAFRVPLSKESGRRIEHRVAGADANPYLVVAAVLAGIHHGLTKKLKVTEQQHGNAGAEIDPQMPTKLWTALDRMRSSEFLKEYLGKEYPAAYADIKSAEFESYLSEITSREYDWYL
ncbi:MAG: glutamine synthetase family protein [Pseudomonadota bacterium]